MSPSSNQPRSVPPTYPSQKAGSVIAAVLGIIVLLSFIVVAFMTDAANKIKYHALYQQNDDLRIEAYSAMEITLAVIDSFREIDGALWGPQQGWQDPLAFAGIEPPEGIKIEVNFEDESGRFSLKNADHNLLALTFEELGFAFDQRDELADCLLDWIDQDDNKNINGFDSEDYEDLNPPYRAANQMLRSWDELKLIHSFKDLFWDEEGHPLPELSTFTDAFSLYSTSPVNINSARPLVLRVLERKGLLNPYNLSEQQVGPDGELGTADDQPIRDLSEILVDSDAANSQLGTESDLLIVEIKATRGTSVFLLRSMVSWRGADPGSGQKGLSRTEKNEEHQDPDEENDINRKRSDKPVSTQTSASASLGYPFQLKWITENRKN